ncbi:uncharacterized protein AB675_2914 [Cyphellophora attinorum]|uniref:Uncharacterized protein n=1 Tax=Cyphellophora attinorum TaxID=1664694 RepID=A0A0N1H3Q9_9EURO|nr:uncharacterized protein AB675_2914 [Phialophora attinorum]KPI36382.1 hypothetical protein AB675_2914 [Phialophora attinorum]
MNSLLQLNTPLRLLQLPRNSTVEMSQVTSAPSWPETRPNLAAMPTEILERIINFAIQGSPFLTVAYWGRPEMQTTPFRWYPEWLPSLLCVSKPIRQVARVVLSRHVELPLDGLYWFPSNHVPHHDTLPPDIKRKYRKHFEKLFGWE